jgi:RHH-type proline utilization regulon transcriptional repressor/proline dehydrogenase/delta 1-pyrroline-5-carboxylate dehydrogenase
MEAKGYTYSYDMLGEARAPRRTRGAITWPMPRHRGHRPAARPDIRANPGISVKLSALHPRYLTTAKRDRVMEELVPRLAELARWRQGRLMGFNIDAEEADRLDLSLDVIEAVAADPSLAGWDGSAWSCRPMEARAEVIDGSTPGRAARPPDHGAAGQGRLLGHRDQARAGAGLDGFPVFTRKAATDLSYIACARMLLA